MENISNAVYVLFAAATVFTVWQLYRATQSKRLLYFIIGWGILISVLSALGFYSDFTVTPPRMMLLFVPVVFVSVILPFTPAGKRFVDRTDVSKLTLLSVVRLPVELTLYSMAVAGLVPDSMTFSTYNFDILSGISAPIMYYLVFIARKAGGRALFIWNTVCLVLLINILTIAVLAIPTPFQQWAYDQPNVGVTYFPFIWLPGIIVPAVLFSHLASMRLLLRGKVGVPSRPAPGAGTVNAVQ